MTPRELRHNILYALRHGPLDQYQIGASVAEAPFRVRAELRAMRRDRLVKDRITSRAIEWELTEAGQHRVWNGLQLHLGEG